MAAVIGLVELVCAFYHIERLNTLSCGNKTRELTHWLSILPAPLFFFWNLARACWMIDLTNLPLSLFNATSRVYDCNYFRLVKK
ncbi:hypothetical protein IM538_13635 [Cytobacillus suaedae]|nr:hypothetical protein IM538_13635 [Cytobacillus suaedae]